MSERNKEYKRRVRPPILNVGRLRIDWPNRDSSPGNILRFSLFVAVLLGLFALLYLWQASLLTSINSREQRPAWQQLSP